MLVTDKFRSSPSQIGELLVAVGAAGVALTVTDTSLARDVQPAAITVTL
jgi:hypothetical protein